MYFLYKKKGGLKLNKNIDFCKTIKYNKSVIINTKKLIIM